ncbi:1-acyl-sn-glycerol-3-phosphate acyltransferase [Chthonomonas calidirosea]|uniref:1-acyl-sn-glycerol-3-phosphate acyltransferase n=1 Tax=Chthonomonas calidirosea (strain DSM 23976 / ICMP 18418 / T49) TaxID=1303518 RepID=S0EXI7_CHTCT|nr:lysophospholipid acyltransferase family protein [Chthonomonas calidirosea]CCW36408.1 1-acyl-sn-glycerol-3-phosphate acyltransferase [Chthonomonas calidirosea T49]CEK17425.1 1-acyl-sn-glycerol-3-phosphate acyltransferase [Chthonomonas calidirosea]
MKAGQAWKEVGLPCWYHRLCRYPLAWIFRLFFHLYGRLQVVGLENIPKTGALLIAANHASDLDPPLGWAVIAQRRWIWGVAKIELWNHPVTRFITRTMHGIPVRRGKADLRMFHLVLELLERGEAIGFFPEGSRSRDGNLQPAQPGLALLVQKSGVPVVPVGVVGTFDMLPPGAKKLRRARLAICFGPPIHFSPDASREQILETVMTAIAQQIEVGKRQVSEKKRDFPGEQQDVRNGL